MHMLRACAVQRLTHISINSMKLPCTEGIRNHLRITYKSRKIYIVRHPVYVSFGPLPRRSSGPGARIFARRVSIFNYSALPQPDHEIFLNRTHRFIRFYSCLLFAFCLVLFGRLLPPRPGPLTLSFCRLGFPVLMCYGVGNGVRHLG